MGLLYMVGGFTHLENISQWEGLSRILWKIKNVWIHQPAVDYYMNDVLTGGCTLELLLLSPFVITYNLLEGKELTHQPL